MSKALSANTQVCDVLDQTAGEVGKERMPSIFAIKFKSGLHQLRGKGC